MLSKWCRHKVKSNFCTLCLILGKTQDYRHQQGKKEVLQMHLREFWLKMYGASSQFLIICRYKRPLNFKFLRFFSVNNISSLDISAVYGLLKKGLLIDKTCIVINRCVFIFRGCRLWYVIRGFYPLLKIKMKF